MKSKLKSVGRIFPVVLILGPLVLAGCTLPERHEDKVGKTAAKVDQALDPEISLKEDRSQLEELRKEVPAQIKESNDELALITKMMGGVNEKPDRIREKFQRMVQKRRESFRKKTQKLRDDFNHDERKARDIYLRKIDKDRQDFKKEKVDREKTKEFYDEQERHRREFFSEQRDQRQEFESEMRIKSKDFEDYMRDRTNEFNEQLRLYSARVREFENEQKKKKEEERKAKAAAASASASAPASAKPDTGPGASPNEFEEMKRAKGTPLGTEEEEGK